MKVVRSVVLGLIDGGLLAACGSDPGAKDMPWNVPERGPGGAGIPALNRDR